MNSVCDILVFSDASHMPFKKKNQISTTFCLVCMQQQKLFDFISSTNCWYLILNLLLNDETEHNYFVISCYFGPDLYIQYVKFHALFGEMHALAVCLSLLSLQ